MPKKLSDVSNRIRQDHVLEILHRAQDGITVTELTEKLRVRGIDVTSKTIRRDVDDLSRDYLIDEQGSRPTRYCYKGSKDIATITMTTSEVQTLAIALCSLKATSHKIFSNSLSKIESRLLSSMADEQVDFYEKTKSEYVFLSSRGQASGGEDDDLDNVLLALRRRRLIKAINDSPYNKGETKLRTFEPLRLVINAGIPYLDAWDVGKDEFRRLRMTRLKQVEILTKSIREELMIKLPSAETLFGGFSIQEEAIKVKITGDQFIGNYFSEQIIHSSQKVSINKDKSIVEWRVPPSHEIIRLLASFSPHIQSILPEKIRLEVRNLLQNGLNFLER